MTKSTNRKTNALDKLSALMTPAEAPVVQGEQPLTEAERLPEFVQVVGPDGNVETVPDPDADYDARFSNITEGTVPDMTDEDKELATMAVEGDPTGEKAEIVDPADDAEERAEMRRQLDEIEVSDEEQQAFLDSIGEDLAGEDTSDELFSDEEIARFRTLDNDVDDPTLPFIMLDDPEVEGDLTPEQIEDAQYEADRQAALEHLLKYEAPINRRKMREHYELMELTDLTALIKDWEETFGDPEGVQLLRTVEAMMSSSKSDPIFQKQSELFEHRRVGHIKLLNDLQRTIGSNNNQLEALITPDYHQAAKVALEENYLMKQVLADVINSSGMVSVDKDPTAHQMVLGLRHLWAHFTVNTGKVGYFLKQMGNFKLDAQKAEKRAVDLHNQMTTERSAYATRLEEIRSQLITTSRSRYFISVRGTDKFLADRTFVGRYRAAVAEGTDPKAVQLGTKLSHKDLIWVSNVEEALPFESPEKAYVMLENILEVMYKISKPEQVHVAGHPLKALCIATNIVYQIHDDLKL